MTLYFLLETELSVESIAKSYTNGGSLIRKVEPVMKGSLHSSKELERGSRRRNIV